MVFRGNQHKCDLIEFLIIIYLLVYRFVNKKKNRKEEINLMMT